jgi:metallo-beta-lactamase class B
MFERRIINHPWEGKMTPFKIIGNVYFCGTFQASCHLIDTGEGLILIDPGYSNALYLVVSSIYELGFKPKDIKYIINTHWHEDHTEATRAMVDLTGAKTLLGRYDEEKAKQYFSPDILIQDGDVLTLGNTTISFMETPGHTKGTISFFFQTEENGNIYRVGMFGGAGANTMVREQFDYDGCREGYRNSLHRLRKENVDVFIGNHVWNNNTYEYGKLLLETGENRFIDNKLWDTFLDFCEKRLDSVIEKERNKDTV